MPEKREGVRREIDRSLRRFSGLSLWRSEGIPLIVHYLMISAAIAVLFLVYRQWATMKHFDAANDTQTKIMEQNNEILRNTMCVLQDTNKTLHERIKKQEEAAAKKGGRK